MDATIIHRIEAALERAILKVARVFGWAVLFGIVWMCTGTARGYIDAHAELLSGRYSFASVGLVMSRVELQRILAERYGVHVDVVALCLVSSWEEEYAEAHNRVMREALRRRYGRDVFAEGFQDARWEFSRKREARRVGLAMVQVN